MTPDPSFGEKALPRPGIPNRPNRGNRPNVGNMGRPSAARWKTLRIEPYDPNARDADGDGIVQEGTVWERPAGTRIMWRAHNSSVARGVTGENLNPALVRIVDADGNDVAYTPTWQRANGGEGVRPTIGETSPVPIRPQQIGMPGRDQTFDFSFPERGESLEDAAAAGKPAPDWWDFQRFDWDALDERPKIDFIDRSGRQARESERRRRLFDAMFREERGERGAVREERRRQDAEDRALRKQERENRKRQEQERREKRERRQQELVRELGAELARTPRMGGDAGERVGLASASLPDRRYTADGFVRRSSAPPDSAIGAGVSPGDVDPEHWSLTARIDEALVAEDGSSFLTGNAVTYPVGAAGDEIFSVTVIARPGSVPGRDGDKELADVSPFVDDIGSEPGDRVKRGLVTIQPETPSGDLEVLDARNPAHRDVLFDAMQYLLDYEDFGQAPDGKEYRDNDLFKEKMSDLEDLLNEERTAQNFGKALKSFLDLYDSVGQSPTVLKRVRGEDGLMREEPVAAYSLKGLGSLSRAAQELLGDDARVDGFFLPNWTDPDKSDVLTLVRSQKFGEHTPGNYSWKTPRRFDLFTPRFESGQTSVRRTEDGSVELPYDPLGLSDEERLEAMRTKAKENAEFFIEQTALRLKYAYEEIIRKLKAAGVSQEEINSDERLMALKTTVEGFEERVERFPDLFWESDSILGYLMPPADVLPRTYVPSDILVSLFADGRFRTQFETGTSMGDYSPANRIRLEDDQFGVPKNLPFRDRPIYGHLPRPAYWVPPNPTDRRAGDGKPRLKLDEGASAYGDVAIVFRPEVRGRTTWTSADSFGGGYGIPVDLNIEDYPEYFDFEEGGAPLWLVSQTQRAADELVDTVVHSTLNRDLIDVMGIADRYGISAPRVALDDPRRKRSAYLEAQIHGGVSLSDVAQLSVPVDSETGRIVGYSEEEDAYVRRMAEQYGIEIVDKSELVTTRGELESRERLRQRDTPVAQAAWEGVLEDHADRIGVDIPPDRWDAEQRLAADFTDDDGLTFIASSRTARGNIAFASRDPKATSRYGATVEHVPVDPTRLSMFDLRNAEHRQKIRGALEKIANSPMIPGGDQQAFRAAQAELLAFLAEADTAENLTSALRALDRLYNAATGADPDTPGAGVGRVLSDLRANEKLPSGNTVALAMADLRYPNNKDVLALTPPERIDVPDAVGEPELSPAEVLRPARRVDLPYDPKEIVDNEYSQGELVAKRKAVVDGVVRDIRNDLAILRERLLEEGVAKEEFTSDPKLRALFGKSLKEWEAEIQGLMDAGEFDEFFREEFEQFDPDLLGQVRVPKEVLEQILKDGRLKTQFETEKSMGAYHPDSRREIEVKQLGVPEDLPDELRPVYGYIPSPGWEKEDTPGQLSLGEYADRYGDIVLVLRPEVRDRTTITPDDSFAADMGLPHGFNLDEHPELLERGPDGTPKFVAYMSRFAINEVRTQITMALIGEQLEGIVEDRELSTRGYASMGMPRGDSRAYVEAQFHGGISLEDVAQISILPDDRPVPSWRPAFSAEPVSPEERERFLSMLRDNADKYGFEVVDMEDIARTGSELAERRRGSAPLAMAESPEIGRGENAAFDPVEEMISVLGGGADSQPGGQGDGVGSAIGTGIFPSWGKRLDIKVQTSSDGKLSGLSVEDPATGRFADIPLEDVLQAIGTTDPRAHIEELLMMQGVVSDVPGALQPTIDELNQKIARTGLRWEVRVADADFDQDPYAPIVGGGARSGAKAGDLIFVLVKDDPFSPAGRTFAQMSVRSVLDGGFRAPRVQFDPVTDKPTGVSYDLSYLSSDFDRVLSDSLVEDMVSFGDGIFEVDLPNDPSKYQIGNNGRILLPVGEGTAGDTGVPRGAALVHSVRWNPDDGTYVAFVSGDDLFFIGGVKIAVPATGDNAMDARTLAASIRERLEEVVDEQNAERARRFEQNPWFFADRKRTEKLRDATSAFKDVGRDSRASRVVAIAREISEEILDDRLESGRYLDVGSAPQTRPEGVPSLADVIDGSDLPEFEDITLFLSEVHGVEELESGQPIKIVWGYAEDYGNFGADVGDVAGGFIRDSVEGRPGTIGVFMTDMPKGEYARRRSVMHEMGHRVDAMPVDSEGRKYFMDRVDDPLVQAFVDAAMATESRERLWELESTNPEYYRYYVSPKELWARVYAAWAMKITKDPGNGEAGNTRQHIDVAQYEPAFAALESILRARGLMS